MSLVSRKDPKSHQIFYSTDLNKRVIKDNCKKRGWIKVNPEDNWNVFWGFTWRCRSLFKRDHEYIMKNNQIINHFPNSYILCRKDFLPMCINKYLNELQKLVKQGGESEKLIPKIIPPTYVLPQDYNQFMKAHERAPNTTWIMKPCCKSQGYGIFLTNDIDRFNKWKKKAKNYKIDRTANNDNYVASKYLTQPLLIGGKKFDLRMYVLVTSYQPLKAYVYKHGFCRFCTVKYDNTTGKLKNHYIHLTNVSVQRRGRSYNAAHGGKWSLTNLKLYLESTMNKKISTKLFNQINNLIIHSLRAVQPAISSDLHCFECYGYDIIIDKELTPWLIEVNASPAMVSTTSSDRILKRKLIDNVFNIVIPPDGYPDIRWNKIPTKEQMGDFERLIDEDLLPNNLMDASQSVLSFISQQSLANRRAICSRRVRNKPSVLTNTSLRQLSPFEQHCLL